MRGRHFHRGDGLPLTMLDDGNEHELHSHVQYLGNDLYSIVLHDHIAGAISRTIVPETELLEHLAHVAAEVDLPEVQS